MIVNKTVFLNPVEPHPLSFRAPMGMETKLNVTFMTRSGGEDTPYSSDIAAQLQLTGRTSSRTSVYYAPATDIANGRIRAVIPADGLNDPNGYRLRLVGTLAGEPALLAMGTVMPVAFAGIEAAPDDVIDTIPLTFDYNNPVSLDVSVWKDAGKNSEYDLTAEATTVNANILSTRGGETLMPFTVTVLDANTVTLSLTAEQVNTLPPSCWWTMVASGSTGATTLAEGSVTIAGTVTPELPETIALYDYQKPPLGDVNPVGGQVIHSNIIQNLLKVAKTTSASVDLSGILELVRAGDTIALGTTTWTVQAATEAVGWYEFTVTPVAQDAVSGVTTVTFRRP